jgi:hypothetical protein
MGKPVNAFDLSPDQQETASLLQRLLGSVIASGYADFCRLAAGAWPLNRPQSPPGRGLLDAVEGKIENIVIMKRPLFCSLPILRIERS